MNSGGSCFFRRFFKSKERALEFAKNVGGKVYKNSEWEYEAHLTYVEYPEGLKEEFEYMVVWF
jgi:hypothetical protein